MAWDGVARFSREIPKSDPREIWEDGGKWEDFMAFLKKAKEDGAHMVEIDCPEVLGDCYREILINLSAISDSGMTLVIRNSDRKITSFNVDFHEKGERVSEAGLVFEQQGVPLLANVGKLHGPYVFREGKEPLVRLDAMGPDHAYCQAYLLLQAEWESYKPAAKGRAISGTYSIQEMSMEEFLDGIPGRDAHAKLEQHRQAIVERGFQHFYISEAAAKELQDVKIQLKREMKHHPKEFRDDPLYRKSAAELRRLEGPL